MGFLLHLNTYVMALWVYSHYKYFTVTVRGSTLRQNLTTKVAPRAVRVKQWFPFHNQDYADYYVIEIVLYGVVSFTDKLAELECKSEMLK